MLYVCKSCGRIAESNGQVVQKEDRPSDACVGEMHDWQSMNLTARTKIAKKAVEKYEAAKKTNAKATSKSSK